MKTNKSLGSYIFLVCGLVVCLAGVAILGFNIFLDNGIKMENFENSTKEDVLKWVTKNKLSDLISYEYEYSVDVDDGMVISQTLEPNLKIEDKFTVTISKGNIATLSTTEFKNIKDFKDFILKFPNVKVAYDGEVKDGSEIEKFSKNSINLKNDELTVYILTDEEPDTIENDDKKEKIDDKDGVLIPNNLLGIKEEDFKKKLNELGFQKLKKDEKKYYSFTSKADMIFSYDDGKISTDKTINYALSLGDYPTAFKADDYNGKTVKETDSIIKKYNDLNAHITLKTNEVQTSDSTLINKLSNCKCVKEGTKSIITCDLNTKEVISVNIDDYSNKSESVFLSELKAKGFTKFNKSTKYSSITSNNLTYNDKGSKKITDTINYTVSLGPYVFNANEYNGKTISAANSLVSNYNSQGANIQFNYQTEETTEHTDGTLYNCDATTSSGTKITCRLAKQIFMYDLVNEQTIKRFCDTCTSYDQAVSTLKGYFEGKFVLSFIGAESALSPGQIVNIKVNNQDSFNAGQYPSTTVIEFTISNKLKN